MTDEALFQQALKKSVFLLTKRGMSELFVNTFFLNLLNKIIYSLRLELNMFLQFRPDHVKISLIM